MNAMFMHCLCDAYMGVAFVMRIQCISNAYNQICVAYTFHIHICVHKCAVHVLHTHRIDETMHAQ